MRNLKSVGIGIVSGLGLITLISCQLSQPGFEANKNKRPASENPTGPKELVDSEASYPEQMSTNGRGNLLIPKSQLKRLFFMTSFMASKLPADQPKALLSRIVFFDKRGSSLVLFEDPTGHTSRSQVSTELPLARFDIVSETKLGVEIDWAQGYTSAYITQSSFSPDIKEIPDYLKAFYDPKLVFETTPFNFSYVAEIDVNKERVQIVQIGQFVHPNSPPTTYPMGKIRELRTSFFPYVENQSFEPSKIPHDLLWEGFFRTYPMHTKSNGRSQTRAIKWDISKPIRVQVSAFTPPDWIPILKEGILYWNRAFGRDVIQVETAAPGVIGFDLSAPVFFDWIDTTSRSAYGQTSFHPVTGEIRQGLVVIQKTYDIKYRADAERLVAQFGKKEEANESLTGHESYHVQYIDLLRSALEEGVDDAGIKKLTEGFIFGIAAHEMGHVLGLRHNFADSHGGSLTYVETSDLFKDYIKAFDPTTLKDVVTSSSVMGYQDTVSEIISSVVLTSSQDILPYDKHAIERLYFGNDSKSNSPLFCTDSQRDGFRLETPGISYTTYLDCRSSQRVSNIFDERTTRFAENLNAFVSLHFKENGTSLKVFKSAVSRLLSGLGNSLKWLDNSSEYLFVDRVLALGKSLRVSEKNKIKKEFVVGKISEVGSPQRVFFPLLSSLRDKYLRDPEICFPVPTLSEESRSNLGSKEERRIFWELYIGQVLDIASHAKWENEAVNKSVNLMLSQLSNQLLSPIDGDSRKGMCFSQTFRDALKEQIDAINQAGLEVVEL